MRSGVYVSIEPRNEVLAVAREGDGGDRECDCEECKEEEDDEDEGEDGDGDEVAWRLEEVEEDDEAKFTLIFCFVDLKTMIAHTNQSIEYNYNLTI